MTTVTNGKATELITFSRASLATVTDADGRIKWAPHNLLLASEQFDASSWNINDGATVTANSTAAPNGTITADTIAFTTTGYRYQNVSFGLLTGVTITARVWLWSVTGKATILLRLTGSGTPTDQTATLVNLTNIPTLYTVTRTFTSADTGFTFGLENRTAVGGDGIAGNVIAWGAHLYRSDLGGMQANASAYPMYNPTTPKNLLGFSEAFDNAAWTKVAASVTANSIAAPNGSLSADFIVPNTTSSAHYVQALGTTVSGTTYQASVYVKAGGYSKVGIRENAATAAYATFNLIGSGSVINQANGGTGSITSVGDGWYRVCMSSAAGGTSINMSIFALNDGYTTGSPLSYTYTGDGTSGIYLWGAQLSDSASLDPYVGSYGAAPTAAAYNGPRLDYNASTLAPLGLLVEEQRTNLFLHSNTFSDAAWTKAGVSITSGAGTGLDGTNSASKLVEDTAGGTHILVQTRTATASAAHSASLFIKAAERSRILFQLDDGAANGAQGSFNLSAGTAAAPTVFGTGSAATSSIENFGNGWYRCTLRCTPATTGSSVRLVVYLLDNSGVASYTGNGTSGVLISNSQLEAGAFATSYIPTAASTVTRSADVASVATSQFPYGSTAGSFVVSYSLLGFSTASILASLNDGTPNNVIEHGVNTSTQNLWRVRVGGANQTSEGVTTTASGINNVGGVYSNNDFAFTANGATVVLDTSGSIPTGISQLSIGNRAAATFICGHIRQITYIPRRLSNAELQGRTT